MHGRRDRGTYDREARRGVPVQAPRACRTTSGEGRRGGESLRPVS